MVDDRAEGTFTIDAPGATSADLKGPGRIVRRPMHPPDEGVDSTPELLRFRRRRCGKPRRD
jgi:hypothetical protein